MIAVYLAMLETDVDRDKFMKLYESYDLTKRNCLLLHYVYWKTMKKRRMLCSKRGSESFSIGNE